MNILSYLLIKTPVETHKLWLKDTSAADVNQNLKYEWSNHRFELLKFHIDDDRALLYNLSRMFTFSQIEYSYVSEKCNKPIFHESSVIDEEVSYFTNKYFYRLPLTYKQLAEFIKYILNVGYVISSSEVFNILAIRYNSDLSIKIPRAVAKKQLPFEFIEDLMDLLFSSNDWQPIYVIYYLNQQISQIEKGRQRFDNDLVTDVKYNVENTYMIKLVYDSHALYNHQLCDAMYSFNLKTLTSVYKTSKSQKELIVSNNKTLDDIISTIDMWKEQIIGDLK